MEGPFVQKVDLAGLYVARFTPGQDLFGRLTEIMGQHDLERVVVLSGIGSLQDVTMRDLKDGIGLPINLDKTNEIVSAGPFELLSLEGSVVPMDGIPTIHLHGVMGMPDGSVIGGHLSRQPCSRLWSCSLRAWAARTSANTRAQSQA